MTAERILPTTYLAIACAAVTFAGCPPEPKQQAAAPMVNMGHWVFEVQDRLSGELGEPPVKVAIKLNGDGTTEDSPAADHTFKGPLSWSITGDVFRLWRGEFPYITYEAVVEYGNYLEGEYYDDANPSFPMGTFAARWIPAVYESDPPDTQI